MRRRVSSTLLSVAALAVLMGMWSATSPAHALSCAAHPDGSPSAIVTGTEQLSTEKPFFDSYDFAITGTVTGIKTDAQPGSVTYGDTYVTVDVINAFGITEVAPTVTVFQDDPGWMAGYPFEHGTAYFIPVQASGPNGEANYSFVCDPITVLDTGAAAALPALALSSISVAQPIAGAPTTPAPATSITAGATTAAPAVTTAGPSGPATPRSPGADVPVPTKAIAWWPVVVVAALVAGALIAFVLLRRNRVGVAHASK